METGRVADVQDMSALGDKLRQAREGKNLTMDQAQKQTRIHSTVLKALEDGKCDTILNPAYVKSFLKQYCEFLGVDSHAALDAYKKFHPDAEAPSLYKIQEAAGDNPGGLSSLIPFIKLIAVGAVSIGILVFAGLKAVEYFNKPASGKKAAAVKSAQKPSAKKTEKKVSAPKRAPAKKDIEISIPKNVQLKLLLKVNQNVFVKMRTDGVLLFERVLTKGTAEMFTADNTINVFAANGDHIELILNGKAIGSPGKGILKNIEITRNGIKLK